MAQLPHAVAGIGHDAGFDVWDSVWADFDRRQSAAATPPVRPAEPSVRRRWRWPRPLLLLLVLPAAWFIGPALGAADILGGIARRDLAPLTARIDWPLVTAGLARDLHAAAGAAISGDAARFLDAMAAEMTAAWQQPAARDRVLAARSDPAAARLQASRLEAPGRIALDFGPGDAVALTMTLSLTDPARLGWAVTGLRFAEARGSGTPPPPRWPCDRGW